MKCLLCLLMLVGSLPAQEVVLPSEPIVFGQAFELTVTAGADFDAGRLLPLVVELLDRTPAGDVEQWRFRARCYEVGAVTLSLEPPVELAVATSLPDPVGELEWPSEGWLIEPETSSAWLAFALCALLAVAGLWWWRTSRVEEVPETVAAPQPHSEWDAMLALRELAMPGGDAYEPFYEQLKAIVRRHCHARFRVPADVRTSEELIHALPNTQSTLQPCLSTCDVALFGGAYGTGQNHQHAKDHAIAFVEATRGGATTEAPQ